MIRQVRILSYNVWLKNLPIGGSKAVDERTDAIARLLGPKLNRGEFDAIIFSEAFNYNELLGALRQYCDGLQSTTPIPADVLAGKIVNGGILIVTNHTIVDHGHTVFRESLDPDKRASKGVAFAEIKLRIPAPAKHLFVFGTHLQSDDVIGGNPVQVRADQLSQMGHFIRGRVPSSPHLCPVVLGGDFNIDRHSPQYAQMLTLLSATHGNLSGLAHTVDNTNHWLSDTHKNEYIDYVMVSQFGGHLAPKLIGNHECIRYRSAVQGVGDCDLSDHYAVVSTFDFDFAGSAISGPIAVPHHHHKRGSDCDHGEWATDDVQGHHHHKRGHDCIHGLWATSSVNGHHHHKRGGDCVEHGMWATSEEFPDDPSDNVDLSTSDRRSYAEVESELRLSAIV